METRFGERNIVLDESRSHYKMGGRKSKVKFCLLRCAKTVKGIDVRSGVKNRGGPHCISWSEEEVQYGLR